MSTHAELKKDCKFVLQYVEAAVSASNRARTVTIVMITTSVLVFTAIWNAGGVWNTSEGWMDSRISLRSAALKLFDPAFDPHDSKLSEDEKQQYKGAEEFIKWSKLDRNNPDDKKKLNEEISQLKRVRNEQIFTTRVPFLVSGLTRTTSGCSPV